MNFFNDLRVIIKLLQIILSFLFISFHYQSVVLRSQSFHSGVVVQHQEDSFDKNYWAVTSTESSDEEDFDENV